MDPNLQEFTKPALYDAENPWGADDEFYLELAQQVGGPVLDVACGTGRLARGLAEAGLQVTGLDLVPAMLERARQLAGNLPITWVEADCRTFALEQRFRCVLMTGNAFQNLLTDADQHAFLSRVHEHLEAGGTLAFETRNLRGKSYGDSSDLVLWKSFEDESGRWIDVRVASRFDPEASVDRVQITRTVRETGEVWPSQIALRYTAVAELNRRLGEHGFTVVAQYGDWSKSPLGPSSPEIITVCRRPADASDSAQHGLGEARRIGQGGPRMPHSRGGRETNMETLDTKASALKGEQLRRLDAYWRAANYLSVGQIYLRDNPLLREPLRREHVKRRLLGHWGTTPGLNFIYVHLNRVIRERDLNVIYVTGPGHGGPGLVANAYLEGTYSEVYPDVSLDAEGMQKLFRQFSFPGGVPSHVAPETPGSIHEGGELGYALSHAYGAVFDNPDLVACCVVGDGEAETGPLATSWHSNKFLNPIRDGAVLPVLHLNGYKIAGPTVLARIPRDELTSLLSGYGYEPHFVEGSDPARMHVRMVEVLDGVMAEIQSIQSQARSSGSAKRPRWPMIVLRSPKGWTGPKEVDGLPVEGTWRSHQVPIAAMDREEHVRLLESWMKSYRPEELFDDAGAPRPELRELPPRGERRMSANPHANGGELLRDLHLPDFRRYAVAVPAPGGARAEATWVQGTFLRDVVKRNPTNFRIMSPDETASNRWGAVFEVTDRASVAETLPSDESVGPDGRVMEVLSEHQCQGWLEGYLLTGRHGIFSCYEAFIHIVDSMFNQHAKWLKVTRDVPWRRPIASLNYLLTSHVWRQDHNGFSHQDPGFIDHVVNKKAEVIRIYLPPDANTLLSVTDHCLRSRHYVNVIVAGKQPMPQWLTMEEAIQHCTMGIGIWEWASNDEDGEPDVVMACCGDVPTLETLAAVDILRAQVPELKVRVVNVVDLMRLQPESEHPHGLPDRDFDALFTTSKPIIFAFHGYPWLIHRLTYRRTNHKNLHVRGYKEEGTTTTPFDMTVLNDMDRFHLVSDVMDRVPSLAGRAAHVRQAMQRKRIEHREYIRREGDDMPEVRDWTWPPETLGGPPA